MGGDHEGGLAVAIMVASLCMLLVPGALGGTIGYLFFRKKKNARWIAGVGGFVSFTAIGVVGVFATFYESTFTPPTALMLDVPPGFAQDRVYLVDDPTASATVPSFSRVPFVQPHVELHVPASGVLRVKGTEALFAELVEARLSNGRRVIGSGGAPLAGGRYTHYFELEPPAGRPWAPFESLDGEALDARLRELEAGR